MDRKIHLLDESVIKRIAAGEVIHGPYNIVKELLENSLDSGASHISIIFKNGGLSLIEITDDGDGINRPDMELVCKRHSTSKIETYSDITKVKTFGFRGEALFSISCISDLSITTNTKSSSFIGLKGEYKNGDLISPLKEVGAMKGTTISVSNLFSNNPQKLAAIPSEQDAKRKVLFMVLKYAIALPNISFTLYRDNRLKVNTPGNGTYESVLKDSFLYMTTFRVDIQITKKITATCFLGDPTKKMMKMHGIFVNNRLVSCEQIKRVMCRIYSKYNVTGKTPFFIILLKIPEDQVDVNVHPTKKNVVFTREQLIVDTINREIEIEMDKRYGHTSSPKKEPQTKFQEMSEKRRERANEYMMSKAEIEAMPVVETKIRPIIDEEEPQKLTKKEKVIERSKLFKELRFKPRKTSLFNDVQTLDAFMKLTGIKKSIKEAEKDITIKYPCVSFMMSEIVESGSPQLSRFFASYTLIGVCAMKYFIVDIREALYTINIEEVTRILFFQLSIFHLGNFGSLLLDEEIDIEKCIAIQEEKCNTNSLNDNIAFLDETFNIHIYAGFLTSLPIIIPGYTPCFARLPTFLVDLAKACTLGATEQKIRKIAEALAEFYCIKESDAIVRNNRDLTEVLSNQIITEMRRSDFHPPLSLFFDGHIKQITNSRHIDRLFAPIT